MDGDLWVAIIAILCAVGLPVVMALVIGVQLIRSRHEERMEMVKNGAILEEPEKKPNRYPALRNGIFMIGLAVGVMIGVWMGPVMNVNDWFDLTIPTMAVLFGGIAFVIYFFLARTLYRGEKSDNKISEIE